MNAVVEILNAVGQEFFEFSLPMLIQSCVLILILLAVDAVLRRRVRAVFRYWIWMLVLVKLVLPPSLVSPVSVGTWFGDTLEVPMERVAGVPPARAEVLWPSVFEGGTPSTPAGKMPATQQPPVPESAISLPTPGTPAPVEHPVVPETGTIAHPPALTWHGLLLLIWAVVAFALMLLLAQRAYFVRGLLGQSEEANGTMLGELEDCRQRLGLHRRVALRLSPNATSPAVCGLLRPVILIPQSIAPRLQPQDLQAVLLHELAHVKRGDLWVNLIQTLLQIAYFYNPLLWLANAMIRRTREQAVDETVLVAMGETAQQYPETLVNIAKLAFAQRPALSLRLIGVVESKSALTARIKHMLNRPLPKTAKLGLAGLTAVAIIGAILLPMAKARPLPRPELDVVSPTEEQDRTVVEVPVSSDGVVTLPNGATVEFLGIHDCGSENEVWWRPEGETLPGAPYGYLTNLRSNKPNDTYEVLFRIRSSAGRTLAKMEWTRGRSTVPGYLHRYRGRGGRDLSDNADDLFSAVLTPWPEADQVRIDIGVGLDNAWEPLGVLDGQASEAVTLADAVIKPAREEGGKTVLTVTHRISDREVRLVAIDRNGSVHESVGQATRQGRGIVGYEPRFELSLAEVRQFRLEAQKLTWMAFENVSLRPGQKTEVRSLLPNGDRQSTGHAEPVAIAKLPNGAVVELVGIRDCAGGDESWWRPDGEALSVAPVDSSGGVRGNTPKTTYEALIRIEAAAGKAFAETKWSDGDRFVPGLVRGIRYGSRPDSDIPREADRLFSIMLHPRRGATETRIDVGVGLDNAWELLGSLDGRASNATVTVPGAVIQPAREEEGKTVVTVSHQFADRAVRLVALDRHGFIRQPTKRSDGRRDDGGTYEAAFGLPPAEIQEVRLEVQKLTWVAFKNVSLRAGEKTEVQIDIGSTGPSDAAGREVVLPNADKRPVVLDLATGELVPLPPVGPEPQKTQQALRELGKGDILYGVDLGDRTLIFLRDAKSEPPSEETGESSVTGHLIKNPPETITVVTKEGRRYKVAILAADERGCTLKYSRIPADRGASGGAPVEPENVDGALELRIAPVQSEFAPGVVAGHRKSLIEGRTPAEGRYLWFPVRPGIKSPPGAVTEMHADRLWLLVHNTEPFIMVPSQGWETAYVSPDTDQSGRPMVRLEFDSAGAERLLQLTKANDNHPLAMIVNGVVVSAPNISSQGTGFSQVLILGNFTDQEVEDLIVALRSNVSPDPAEVADSSSTDSARARLEFRIAPKAGDVPPHVLESVKRALADGDGVVEGDFAWFPIRMDLTGQPYAITHESGGKAYVLLWNKPPHVILASQDWGLESVYRATYANLQQGIGLIFNDKGASLFHDLTAAHVQQNLAIVVEGTVVAMPNISAPLGRAAIITGNFTEQEIEVLLAVLERLTVGSQR